MSIVHITDTIFFTDDAEPVGIRAFNLGTKMVTNVLSYTMETEQVQNSITPLNTDGFNRTLRPRSLAFCQEASDRASLLWVDAGAGAIFGMRLDGTPMGVVVSGLHTPEEMVLDGSAVDGFRLYWSDVGTNRIETCRLVGNADTLLTCQEVSPVVTDAPAVTGLGIDGGLQVLYWLDNGGKRLVAGVLSDPPLTNPPTAPVVTSVTTLVDGIELPVGLAVEPAFVGIAGALFWLDQRTPASLTKLWLNGSGAVPLVTGGLSAPRAAYYQLGAVYVADAGTGSLLVVEAVSGRYAEELVQDDALRPRGIAMREDVDARVGVIYDSITSGAPSRAPPGAHLWLLLTTVAISWLRRLRLE